MRDFGRWYILRHVGDGKGRPVSFERDFHGEGVLREVLDALYRMATEEARKTAEILDVISMVAST